MSQMHLIYAGAFTLRIIQLLTEWGGLNYVYEHVIQVKDLTT